MGIVPPAGLETQQVFSQKDGLPQDVIYQIEEDQAGHIWVMQESSVSRIRFTDGPNPVVLGVDTYDQADGLQEGRLSGYAMTQGRDGHIYMGGPIELSVFHPDSMQQNPYVPPLVFTDFKFGGASVAIEKDGALPQHIFVTSSLTLKLRLLLIRCFK